MKLLQLKKKNDIRHCDLAIRTQIEGEKMEQLAKMYAALGSFKESSFPKETTDHPEMPNSKVVRFPATFENGSGTVSIVAEKKNGNWLVQAIHISSEAFLAELKNK